VNARFQPGDHIQGLRSGVFYHHGIYISDDRIIQFGSVNFTNKRGVINAVSLKDFEERGPATVVRHGFYSPFTAWHPPADEPWKVIARAEFLLRLQPKLPYNLIGHNCEVIANMCASGGWTESYQARWYFAARVITDEALLLWIGSRSRAGLPIPRWVLPVVVAGGLASMYVKYTYDNQIKQFWQEIRSDWQAHERMLEQDPRNWQAP
jgi:hypothetical protein